MYKPKPLHLSPYKSHQPQELSIPVATRWQATAGLLGTIAITRHGQGFSQNGTLKGCRDIFKVEPTHAGNATESSDPAFKR